MGGDGLDITTMLLGQDLPYPTYSMVSQGKMHVNGTLLLDGRVVDGLPPGTTSTNYPWLVRLDSRRTTMMSRMRTTGERVRANWTISSLSVNSPGGNPELSGSITGSGVLVGVGAT